jgi:hypothetical protein
MGFLATVPAFLRWLIYVLVVIVILILVALVVHALGGFDWVLKIGHFHMTLGVT